MFRFKNSDRKSSKKSQLKKYFNKISEDKTIILKKECRREPSMHRKFKLPRRPGIFARSFPINLQAISYTNPTQPQPESFQARLNNNLALLMNHKSTVEVPINTKFYKPHFYNEPIEPNHELEDVQAAAKVSSMEQLFFNQSSAIAVNNVPKSQFDDSHKSNHGCDIIQPPTPRIFSMQPFVLNNKSTVTLKNVPKPQFYNEFNEPNNGVQSVSSVPTIQHTNTSSITISNASFKNVVTSTPFPIEYRSCEPVIRHQVREKKISKQMKRSKSNINEYIKVFEELSGQIFQLAKRTSKRFPKFENTKSCLERLSKYSESFKPVPQTPVMSNKIFNLKTPFLEYVPPLELSCIFKSPKVNTWLSPCKLPQNNKLNNSFFLNTEISKASSKEHNIMFDSPDNVSNFFDFHFDHQHYMKNDFRLKVRDYLLIILKSVC